MNGTDVTGPCAAEQYGLIMLTCGSQKIEFRQDFKLMGRTAELRIIQFGYWKTEPSNGFPQTPNSHTTGCPKKWFETVVYVTGL